MMITRVPRNVAWIGSGLLLILSGQRPACAQHGGGGGHAAGGGAHAGGGRSIGGTGGAIGHGAVRGGYGSRGHYGWHGYGWGPGWGWPFGLYLSVLPWYYSTFWWNGVPYYFVGDDYYVWDDAAGQYQQVQPPPQVIQQASNAPPSSAEPFAYPKNGQSPTQQATDKEQCRSWARSQTGPASEAATPTATYQDYLRAEAACLEARGYSVD